VILKLFNIPFCQRVWVDVLSVGAQDDFVIHIRVIHGMSDIVTAVFQIAADDIKN